MHPTRTATRCAITMSHRQSCVLHRIALGLHVVNARFISSSGTPERPKAPGLPAPTNPWSAPVTSNRTPLTTPSSHLSICRLTLQLPTSSGAVATRLITTLKRTEHAQALSPCSSRPRVRPTVRHRQIGSAVSNDSVGPKDFGNASPRSWSLLTPWQGPSTSKGRTAELGSNRYA